jgi:hypothetical protein
MNLMKKLRLFLILYLLSSCNTKNDHSFNQSDKEDLLLLERKWLEAEFVLDTAYISSLIDSTFIGISSIHTTDKRQELIGIFNNMSAMRRDSIFLDSLKLEDALVNFYDNTAVATFIVHSYKKDKGEPIEQRTRFTDVWIFRNGQWKAVASQGTPADK